MELQERWNDAAYAYKRAFEEKHTLSEATASAEQEQDALGRAAVAFARAGNGCNADLTFRQAKGLRPGGSSASVEKGHRDFLAAQSQRVIGADEIFCVLTQSKDIGVEPVIELHNIHFDFDSDKLRNGEQAQVDELSKGLSMVVEKDPGARFKLVGHTDERGTAKHNMDLSWRRASTIERALAERQPSLAVRLDTDGRGKEEPLVRQAQSEDDHQLNRRVEIHRE